MKARLSVPGIKPSKKVMQVFAAQALEPEAKSLKSGLKGRRRKRYRADSEQIQDNWRDPGSYSQGGGAL